MGGIDVYGPGNKVIKLADPQRNQYVFHPVKNQRAILTIRRTLDFQAQPQ